MFQRKCHYDGSRGNNTAQCMGSHNDSNKLGPDRYLYEQYFGVLGNVRKMQMNG